VIWNRQPKAGYVFGSNAGFTLPNNAVRSPDSAFIRKDQWEKVAKSDRKKFAHICPDFVIELLSESDQLKASQEKMTEWMDNGCQLAWMINPQKKETSVYRNNKPVEVKPFTSILEGEDVLPNFTLDLSKIFIN
jgi:Uma2 family endonuclease